MKFTETRNGILTKLGLFSAAGIGLFLVSKRHTTQYKELRHKRETDAQTDSEYDEFGVKVHRPGLPHGGLDRPAAYQGRGSAYASRSLGDRFSLALIWDKKRHGHSSPEENDR